MDYKELLAGQKQNSRAAFGRGALQGARARRNDRGKDHRLRNFGNIVDTLRRDREHFLKYLLKELGTPGTFDGTRVIFQTRNTFAKIAERINNYVETYVICSECRRPTPTLSRMTGRLRLSAMRAARSAPDSPQGKGGAAEGFHRNVIEITIDAIGQKGRNRKNRRIYYLRAGSQKGSKLKVKIKTISGKLAFGEIAK
jgi:translation initiation factor 2 subunit 2